MQKIFSGIRSNATIDGPTLDFIGLGSIVDSTNPPRNGQIYGYHFLLNILNGNRGNSYGYNHGTQLRAGQKPIARLLRKRNQYSCY